MTITATSLTSGSNSAAGSPENTASISPSPNKLILAAVAASAVGSPNTPTLAGLDLTWVQVATVQPSDTNPRFRITVHRTMGVGVIPTPGVVAITCASNTGLAWSIVEFGGVDTSGTFGSGAIVQSATLDTLLDLTDTSLVVPLSVFGDAVNNAAYGAFVCSVNEAQTPGSGFAELHDVGYNTPQTRIQTEWFIGQDLTVDASSATTAKRGGVAIEIKAALPASIVFPRPKNAILRRN